MAAQIDLERVLFEFAGESAVIADNKLSKILRPSADIASKTDLLAILRRLGFLGIETSEHVFDYGGTEGEMRRAEVLSRKFTKAYRKPQRYQIHPAYRSYLEIQE